MTLAALQQCKFGHLEEYLGFWLCHEHQGRKWLGQQSPVCDAHPAPPRTPATLKTRRMTPAEPLDAARRRDTR